MVLAASVPLTAEAGWRALGEGGIRSSREQDRIGSAGTGKNQRSGDVTGLRIEQGRSDGPRRRSPSRSSAAFFRCTRTSCARRGDGGNRAGRACSAPASPSRAPCQARIPGSPVNALTTATVHEAPGRPGRSGQTRPSCSAILDDRELDAKRAGATNARETSARNVAAASRPQSPRPRRSSSWRGCKHRRRPGSLARGVRLPIGLRHLRRHPALGRGQRRSARAPRSPGGDAGRRRTSPAHPSPTSPTAALRHRSPGPR